MADRESYELDIEINSQDIDEAEEKLSRLDKMLILTQRRFNALGKTRINPKITLDDRLSPAVTRIRDNLLRLDRTIVKPIASLIDHVSADVGVIRSSLISLTQNPWRISVEGVDWDAVVGQSFDDWKGAEGKSTLQRIFSSLENALGEGLKDFIIKTFGTSESLEGSSSLRGLFNQNPLITEPTSESRSHPHSSSRGSYAQNPSKDEEEPFDLTTAILDQTKSDLEKEMSKVLIQDVVNESEDYWKTNDFSLKRWFESNEVKDILDKPAVKKTTEFTTENADLIKGLSYLDFGISAYQYITAETGRERAGVVGSYTVGTIASGVGTYFGGPVGGFIAGVGGSLLGESVGTLAYDVVYDKDVYEKRKGEMLYWGSVLGNYALITGQLPALYILYEYFTTKEKELRSKLDNTSDMQPIYFNGKEIPQRDFTSEEWRALNTGRVSFGQLMSPNIYVTLPEGAVNMTVNKEENIDYEELVSLVGWQVANAVRYAEQNSK